MMDLADRLANETPSAELNYEASNAVACLLSEIESLRSQLEQMTNHIHDLTGDGTGWWTCNSCGYRTTSNHEQRQAKLEAEVASLRSDNERLEGRARVLHTLCDILCEGQEPVSVAAKRAKAAESELERLERIEAAAALFIMSVKESGKTGAFTTTDNGIASAAVDLAAALSPTEEDAR